MRDERRKKERSKQRQTNEQGKATQHTQGSLFLEKNELPQVGLEPTTLYTLDRALYQLSYRGSSAGWAQNLTSHSKPDELSIRISEGSDEPGSD